MRGHVQRRPRHRRRPAARPPRTRRDRRRRRRPRPRCAAPGRRRAPAGIEYVPSDSASTRRCSTQCTPSPGSGGVKSAARVRSIMGRSWQTGQECEAAGSTFPAMVFDVKRVRAQYPALQGPTVYLDGAAGTQSPESVIEAIARGVPAGHEQRRRRVRVAARGPTATPRPPARRWPTWSTATPAGVVLGPNMTTLTYRFARTLADGWQPGDNVVVTRLDHDANVRPWVQLAARAGVVVRWAEVDLDDRRAADRAVRRARRRAHPAGRGHRGQQRARHPAGRARDHRPRPGRAARCPTSTGCTRPRTVSPTCRRTAATSTRPAPTSGPARTSAA